MFSRWQKSQSVIIIILAGLVFMVSVCLLQPDLVPAQNSTAVKPAAQLPTIQSMAQLRTLVSQSSPIYRYMEEGTVGAMNKAAVPSVQQDSAAAGQYSSTNVQVAGVDEADLIKTDGSYIYQLSNDSLIITRALPANQMKVMSRLQFSDTSFSPADFYIHENSLVLIGSARLEAVPQQPLQPSMEKRFMPPYHTRETTTRVIIYDCSDKSKLVKTRELEVKGNYLSSRRIGQTLYLISNDSIRYYASEDTVPLPAFRDTAAGEAFVTIPCEKIRYFPDCGYHSYLIAAALEIDQPRKAAQVDSYLGSAENVYASSNNIYIALPAVSKPTVVRDSAMTEQPQNTTQIFQFHLNDQKISYAACGSVPGQILNQFSMDEYNGFFRIATTTNKYTADTSTSSNNLYVLDEVMQIKGKLEDLAPGEQIYSARFMGNRAYLVTFRTVDPLFAIDLSNPAQPRILGKLKIPGYSNYLHPYDENHLIGFGKDTMETKGYNGVPQAYYLGMKVALFDVSKVDNPREMDKVIIGDRGTDSELLNNHRALLFARDKQLLAFPVTVAQVDASARQQTSNSSPAYGTFSFQGAYVYNINLEGGLKYKGRITHLSQEDYLKAGDYSFDPDKSIQRILYIGNNLYSVSNKKIQANQISDLKLVGSLDL